MVDQDICEPHSVYWRVWWCSEQLRWHVIWTWRTHRIHEPTSVRDVTGGWSGARNWSLWSNTKFTLRELSVNVAVKVAGTVIWVQVIRTAASDINQVLRFYCRAYTPESGIKMVIKTTSKRIWKNNIGNEYYKISNTKDFLKTGVVTVLLSTDVFFPIDTLR